jgi:hypothetical protein
MASIARSTAKTGSGLPKNWYRNDSSAAKAVPTNAEKSNTAKGPHFAKRLMILAPPSLGYADVLYVKITLC